MKHPHIDSARQILIALGLPPAQQNERSALSLLALIDLRPNRTWAESQTPLMGITPIMDWIRKHYKKTTRQTAARRFAASQCISLWTQASRCTIPTNPTGQ